MDIWIRGFIYERDPAFIDMSFVLNIFFYLYVSPNKTIHQLRLYDHQGQLKFFKQFYFVSWNELYSALE